MNEKTEKRLGDSLLDFIQQLRFRMNIVENSLQTEESGNKIAFLQGNCAGFRNLCGALKDAGFDDYSMYKAAEKSIFTFDEKDHDWKLTIGKYEELIPWESAALDVEEALELARKPLTDRINKRKDWLFYNSEKGRDLYWTKGWYCIISAFEDWCVKIHEAYKIAKKEHDYSLNFDDDE